jgi:hypothetical protein
MVILSVCKNNPGKLFLSLEAYDYAERETRNAKRETRNAEPILQFTATATAAAAAAATGH